MTTPDSDNNSPITVNRKREIAHFRRMLDGRAPRLWLIEGDSGTGKSTLLDYLIYEICEREFIPYYLHDFRDASPTFVHLTVQTVRKVSATTPVALNACLEDFSRNGVQITLSNVRANVGGKVVVEMDTQGLGRLSEPQLALWQTRFAQALIEDLEQPPSVLFVDTFENAHPDTKEWLFQILLPMVLDSASQLYIVICGQQLPTLGVTLKRKNVTMRLAGLSNEDWIEYAQQFAEQYQRPKPDLGVLRIFWDYLHGNPSEMVKAVTFLCKAGMS